MDSDVCEALRLSANAMQSFRMKFGVELSFSRLCEIYAALQLGLPMPVCGNTKGFDLRGTDGARYQVKARNSATLNLDINNFDFDYMVLVNVSDDYRPAGMWKLGVDRIRALSAERGKFRKYQLTQKAFKQAALSIDVGALRTSLMSARTTA